jgi:uncharacterized protein
MNSPINATAPFNLVLSVGTQVVSRVDLNTTAAGISCLKGAVGVITQSPTDGSHAYQVRLPNGQVVSLKRHEFSIRKHFQAEGIERTPSQLAEYNLYEHVIYRCVVGSRAYGLEDDASDTDLRGIYLPPADLHWSLYGIPEQLEQNETQECYWELQKFIVLALKANPNVLECLYSPLVELTTPLAQELLELRSLFLSACVPDLQRLCFVAVQKARAGSAQSRPNSLETRDAFDPAVAVWDYAPQGGCCSDTGGGISSAAFGD